ncbi:MAG TPA: exodeoxyribonuclease V subunit gamma [Verrucomicrobiae bacterium]|nr:exodeoxyribonuclease V subunit gamma [Verrucomicrobiae bacterium]
MADEPIKPGLHLFTSNRMEILGAKLADRLLTPLPSPLMPEIIVVRNQGMERWLKLELAGRHGIAANYQFPFPEAFGHRVFRELLPDLAGPTPWDREVLTWRILQVLPPLLFQPEFGPLRFYLGDPPDPRKAMQLAGRLAHLFDQYVVFRPAMVLGWEEGALSQAPPQANAGRNDHGAASTETWQAMLWRALAAGFPSSHGARLWKQFRELVARAELPASNLPPRVSIFGVSAVPPLHLDLLAGLARHRQINLFLLQPSQEYWGEITAPRERDRILRRHGDAGGPAEAFQLHLEAGHPLLASLGYLGRDFLKLLLEAGDWIPDETFEEPGEDTLLHAIQSDILHLRDREETATTPCLMVAAGDDSIQVHSCHSPLRELEVLQDHLLDWLQRDPTLAPHDMVVMTPDIDTYAPLVQAVFGAPETEQRFIPFSVADRAGRRQSRLIETFLQLLEAPDARLGSASVLELLETPAVRARFELGEPDLETIRDWIEETNIRWGIDAQHRQRLELPALGGNTWREGLDRLLLGYGMTGGGPRLFQGILPHENLDTADALVLGHFLDFIDRLVETAENLAAPRPLPEWLARLHRLLDDFFAVSEETVIELQLLRTTLEELSRQHLLSRHDRPVGLTELRDRLALALADDIQQAGFLTGGVTFCGLKPMRSIPFRVVCLVGMDDGAFPRPRPHLSFDLMARQPRLGDRSTREDDRYLFLETLLSARDRLYLSYVGQSLRDNSVMPPSVLVSELLDCIGRGFRIGSGELLKDRVVTRHPLQAFSEQYFRPGGRLFSYSHENCAASDSVRRVRQGPAGFCSAPLGEPVDRWREVTLDQLAEFLASPCKFFLRHRLGVMLSGEAAELEEHEPFVLNALENHRIKQEWVGQELQPRPGPRADARQDWLAAAGLLPLGEVGRTEYRRLDAAVERFVEMVRANRADPFRPALDIDLALTRFHVTGRIREFTNAGPLLFRCAKAKPIDVLRAWTLHLAVNLIESGSYTTLVAEDGCRHYTPPAEARALLEDLLEVYWMGLRAPLKFFSATAFAFAEGQRKASGGGRSAALVQAKALEEARKSWEGNEYRLVPAERDQPAIALCFRDRDPLDADFVSLVERIVNPILYHEVKEEP